MSRRTLTVTVNVTIEGPAPDWDNRDLADVLRDPVFQAVDDQPDLEAVIVTVDPGTPFRSRRITTEAQLAELPNFAVIRDNSGDVSERRAGEWCGYDTERMGDHRMAKFLPATVLDEGNGGRA